jgi:hypothetical protein
VEKLVAQQEAPKRALDFFVSVHRMTRANSCARELPRAHSGHRERRDRFIVNAPIGSS